VTIVPTLDATHGNPTVATITVDEFTLHALIGCAMTTAQNPRLADELLRLLGEAEREFATDTGHLCRECGRVVSWLDHLPPVASGEPVRCFAGRLGRALEGIA
jgi:hypothetical protein